jgi:hypothetical protein
MKTTAMKIPKTAITERKLRKLLIESIGPEGNGSAWSKEHGITPQQVSAFERQVQGPGLKIPSVLGYKPQIIYIPVDEEELFIKPPLRGKAEPTKDEVMAQKAKDKKKAKKKKKKKDKKK